jgi:antitoxin VapB
MSLNIKNEETHRLAREVAARTGETLTTTITVALRERLARLRGAAGETSVARADRVRAIAADAATRWSPELREREHGDMLYDERGLPR